MPTYFFHLHEEDTILRDEEGIVLVDDAAARIVAVRVARDLLAEAVQRGRLPLTDIVVVTDDTGQTVLSLNFAAAVGDPAP